MCTGCPAVQVPDSLLPQPIQISDAVNSQALFMSPSTKKEPIIVPARPIEEATMFEGGCTCRNVRYRMTSRPLIVHCCHCRWCQRETGASFALNAVIEADRVTVLDGKPEVVLTPSLSGKGQTIVRCPQCKIAVWSHYSGGGDAIDFIRVGTLDDPDAFPPDVHIFTSSKQPWVVLPPGAKAFAEFYVPKEVWPAESLQRWKATRS
jgi:hypothetical protein